MRCTWRTHVIHGRCSQSQTHTPTLTNSFGQTTRVHSTHNRTQSPATTTTTTCHARAQHKMHYNHAQIDCVAAPAPVRWTWCVYHRAREWDNNCSEWQTRPDWSALTHACRTRICTCVRRVRVYAGTNCDQINSYLYSSEHADMWASVLANMPIVTQGLFLLSFVHKYIFGADRCIRATALDGWYACMMMWWRRIEEQTTAKANTILAEVLVNMVGPNPIKWKI